MKTSIMKKILKEQLTELRSEEWMLDRISATEYAKFQTVTEATAKAQHDIAKAIADVKSQLAKL